MSTITLIILAVLTAAVAVGALWFMRWQEEKRLERARQALRHADAMGELSMIGESLSPWFSAAMMSFLAARIQQHGQSLSQLNTPPNQRTNRALENAANWSAAHKPAKARLPSQSKQAQNLRNMLQHLIEYIRSEYQAHRLAADQARSLLTEARQLNIKVAVAVFEGKAAAAESMSNYTQAIHYLRKSLAAMRGVDPLPADMAALSERLQARLQEQQEIQQQYKAGTRLESGTAQLAEEDEAWKKKHF